MCYAAYIRGAIAYGLSQNLTTDVFGNKIGNNDVEEVEVVQNAILSLVMLTTVVIGGFTPLV